MLDREAGNVKHSRLTSVRESIIINWKVGK